MSVAKISKLIWMAMACIAVVSCMVIMYRWFDENSAYVQRIPTTAVRVLSRTGCDTLKSLNLSWCEQNQQSTDLSMDGVDKISDIFPDNEKKMKGDLDPIERAFEELSHVSKNISLELERTIMTSVEHFSLSMSHLGREVGKGIGAMLAGLMYLISFISKFGKKDDDQNKPS